MPLYLSRFSYTPETWAKLIGNPEDRRKAAQSYIESVGGKLHGFWYAFGTHDGYNLWEAPDNVSMAAVALAISGGGALSSFETTLLLTVDETWMPCARQSKSDIERPALSGEIFDNPAGWFADHVRRYVGRATGPVGAGDRRRPEERAVRARGAGRQLPVVLVDSAQ